MGRSESVVVVATLLLAAYARADLPLGPPQDYEIRSPNGRYVAKITVTPPQTSIYKIENGRELLQWSMDGFHRQAYLADDGEHLVIGYVNLAWAGEDDSKPSVELPAETKPKPMSSEKIVTYSPDMTILQFLKRDEVFREIKFRELIDPSKKWRSASSWNWGNIEGINDRNELVAYTHDHRGLYFDVSSGQLVRTEVFYRALIEDLLRHHPALILIVPLSLGALVGLCFRGRVIRSVVTSAGSGMVWLAFLLLLFGTYAGNAIKITFFELGLGLGLVLLPVFGALVVCVLWKGCARLASSFRVI